MDLNTFLSQLDTLVLLPHDVRNYASEAAPSMTDSDRATLMAEIQKGYTEIEKLEAKRAENFDQGMKELATIQKKHMPGIRATVESQQQTSAQDQATKNLNDNL